MSGFLVMRVTSSQRSPIPLRDIRMLMLLRAVGSDQTHGCRGVAPGETFQRYLRMIALYVTHQVSLSSAAQPEATRTEKTIHRLFRTDMPKLKKTVKGGVTLTFPNAHFSLERVLKHCGFLFNKLCINWELFQS